MSDLDGLRRAAVVGVVVAVIVAVPATAAFFAAFGWNVEAAMFGNPDAILGEGQERAALLRWGAIGDMFYSYLMLAPLALFLHRRLRSYGPWLADLGLAAALSYIVAGGAGAAILAIVGSSVVEAHALAAATDQAPMATLFGLVRDLVYFALWQMLGALTLGTWVLTTGVLLLTEREVVGRLLVVLGAGAMLASVMTMLGTHSLAVLAAGAAGALAAWVGWLLIAPPHRAGA